MRYEVWMEGYTTLGNTSTAIHLGSAYALSFEEACIKVCGDGKHEFNQEDLTVWGCKLFDNEISARRRFG